VPYGDSLVNTDYDSIIMAKVKKQVVREAILNSAFRLFSRLVYESTTLSAIAALHRHGLTHGTAHFKSKPDGPVRHLRSLAAQHRRPGLIDKLAVKVNIIR